MDPKLLGVAQTVIMGIAAVLVGIVIRSFNAGKWAQAIDHGPELERFKAECERRFDRAGKLQSDLASEVQGLEDRFAQRFVSRDVHEIIVRESREDRARLWLEIDHLRQMGNRRVNPR